MSKTRQNFTIIFEFYLQPKQHKQLTMLRELLMRKLPRFFFSENLDEFLEFLKQKWQINETKKKQHARAK